MGDGCVSSDIFEITNIIASFGEIVMDRNRV